MKKKMKKMKKEKKKVIQLAYDVTERFASTIDRQINERTTSYEKGTQLRKGCEVTKRLRNKLRKNLVTKLPNYVVVIRIC